MTNPTQPTPEQQWREDAQKLWNEQGRTHWVNMNGVDNYAAGYKHAKQENEQEITQLKADIANALQALTDTAIVSEQAMKPAKFGAMVIRNQYLDDKEQFILQLQSCGIADMHWNIPLEMRTVILETLK